MNTYTGGLSVEFYTDGQHTIQDIDIITVAEKELNQILFKFEILQFVANDWKYGSELVKETGLTAATISYHMNTLVQARLVDIKKDEKKVYFRQNRDYISEMLSFCEKSIQKK